MVEGGQTYIKASDGMWYKLNDAMTSQDGRYYSWFSKKKYIKKFKEGGLADYTGPAWVDGSAERPERILTAHQNELFEGLVKTLEELRTLKIPTFAAPSMNAFSNPTSGGFVIEQININVDKLENDADYEEIANQVGKVLENRMTRGKAIGGIRIR